MAKSPDQPSPPPTPSPSPTPTPTPGISMRGAVSPCGKMAVWPADYRIDYSALPAVIDADGYTRYKPRLLAGAAR